MMRLGLPIPETWMIPAKAYEPREDLQITLERYARLFDLGEIGRKIGYPLFMKPYDGGAWVGVNKIDDDQTLHNAYNASGTKVMNLQAAVLPHDRLRALYRPGTADPQSVIRPRRPAAMTAIRWRPIS